MAAGARVMTFPYDPSPSFDGLVCGLPVAARRAADYAEYVFAMDADDRGLQSLNPKLNQLIEFLPPSAPERVRKAAIEHLARRIP